ncbi:MAG: DnaT-like ssDNA-binding protein [Christensenellaceae bacterium]|jgi:hypothetical protein
MSIEIGVDSYVTAAQATEYIESWYTAQDEKKAAWEGLSAADREACLRRAATAMERLRYTGVKKDFRQALSFPRTFTKNGWADEAYVVLHSVDAQGVPKDVCHAQIEEALELASPGESTEQSRIRKGAVKSYSVGHLSESYSVAAASEAAALCSQRAYELLLPYVGGGFDVR